MQLVGQERHIEQSKIRLIEHTDFNIFDAFKMFDQMGKGSLTISEIHSGLVNTLGLIPTNQEMDLFFTRYDKDRDGRLRFAEFCQAFVPIDRGYSQLLNNRQGSRRPDSYGYSRPDEMFMPVTIMDL